MSIREQYIQEIMAMGFERETAALITDHHIALIPHNSPWHCVKNCIDMAANGCADIINAIRALDIVNDVHLTERLGAGLQLFGVDEERSQQWAKLIADSNLAHHRSLDQWLRSFIIEAASSRPVSPPGGAFNTLYSLGTDRWGVHFMPPGFGKKAQDGKRNKMIGEFVPLLFEDPRMRTLIGNRRLFFHGTGHLDADDILKYGINLNWGEGRREFSHRDGYYVTCSLQLASEIALMRNQDAAAVIVYAISVAEMNADYDNAADVNNDDKIIVVGHRTGHSRGLDLYAEGENKWQEVVRFFKKGADRDSLRGDSLERKQRFELLKYRTDYIRGPYLQGTNADASAVGFMPPPQYSGDLRADVLWRPPLPPGANQTLYEYNSEQYCIRSSRLAARFDERLICVAYWPTRPISSSSLPPAGADAAGTTTDADADADADAAASASASAGAH